MDFNPPSTAELAWSAAEEAKRKASDLSQRVAYLGQRGATIESTIDGILKALSSFSNKVI